MIKELTPLRALKEIGKLKDNECNINTTVEYKIVEIALKALEIIKEKEVVVPLLIRSNTLDEYNNNPMFVSKLLTQTEYDLLKEVLL